MTEYQMFLIGIGIAVILGYALLRYLNGCNHKWKVIHHYTTQSQAQHIGELTNKIPTPSNDYQLDKMTARKTITILSCENCGKLNKTIIQN